MAYLAYGLVIAFFALIGYEIGKLIIGSIKDRANGKS